MRAGILKHYVALQEHHDVWDPITGDISLIWETMEEVWAEVAPLSGREFIAANATQSEVIARITIRYREDITSDWRILFRDKIYNIEAILPDMLSGLDYLTLPCSQGVNDG